MGGRLMLYNIPTSWQLDEVIEILPGSALSSVRICPVGVNIIKQTTLSSPFIQGLMNKHLPLQRKLVEPGRHVAFLACGELWGGLRRRCIWWD